MLAAIVIEVVVLVNLNNRGFAFNIIYFPLILLISYVYSIVMVYLLEKARKSKWYQLEINKDLYIVKDVSGFSLPDAAETFKKQISLLIEQIRDSLAVMNEFFEKYIYGHDDKKLIETNYSGIVTACSMFDQGGYVYRDYLYKEASQYIKDKRVVSAYKALEKKWHSLTKNIRKKCDKSNMSYDEYCELFGMLKEQVNYELETHIEVINMLQ